VEEEMTMAQLRLETGIPWPRKLVLAERAARFEAEAAAWEAEAARLDVRAEVKKTYYDIYVLDEAINVTRAHEVLLAELARVASARYAVARAGQPDALEVVLERAELLEELTALTQERTAAAARLNALLGRAAEDPVSRAVLPAGLLPAPSVADGARSRFATDALPLRRSGEGAGQPGALGSLGELQQLARERSPMLRAHASRVEARRAAVSLAEQAVFPDLSVSAAYSHRSSFRDLFDLTISAPLPLFTGRKQNQAVLEHRAVLAEHEARHDAAVADVEAEVASLRAALIRIQEQLGLLAMGILPTARALQSSAAAAYGAGQGELGAVLEAQASVYRYELEYHRLAADYASTLASLERLVGEEVIP
jgi:outer membrane protein TolC